MVRSSVKLQHHDLRRRPREARHEAPGVFRVEVVAQPYPVWRIDEHELTRMTRLHRRVSLRQHSKIGRKTCHDSHSVKSVVVSFRNGFLKDAGECTWD